MPATATKTRQPAETRQRLLDATVRLMQRQGFTGTTVDQICAEAGLTKGSFFHYFENKEAIGRAAADWWGAMGTELYSAAWKNPAAGPLEQLHRMFDIMTGLTKRLDDPCVCLVGMLSQEMAGTNSNFRDVCSGHLSTWTENVRRLLAAAKKLHPPVVDFDPGAVAWYLNSLWQGSMLIAKTRRTQEMIADNIRMARAWVDGFFGLDSPRS